MTPRPSRRTTQDGSYEPHTSCRTSNSVDWRVARLALQRRMGLLPERRTWNYFDHSSGSGLAGARLDDYFNPPDGPSVDFNLLAVHHHSRTYQQHTKQNCSAAYCRWDEMRLFGPGLDLQIA